MLIQDMPSLRPSVPVGPAQVDCQVNTQPVANAESQAEFDRQLAILIEQHKSYPSIVTWVRQTSNIIDCGLTVVRF